VADEILGVDLFGNPFVPRHEGRGRPPHVPTRETRNRVILCLVRELSLKDTASVIGISVPTLREHYSSELAMRATAALRMEMRQLERLNAAADGGNVAAEKELWVRLEKLRLRDKHRAAAPAPAKQPKLGKKAEAEQRAIEHRGLYEPPSPPALTH